MTCQCGHPAECHVEVYDEAGTLRDTYCGVADCDAACGSLEEPASTNAVDPVGEKVTD
jgi:hypothetical protein